LQFATVSYCVEPESKTMNGFHLSDYKNFEKKWKLITVRYRKDTQEMRFTYANPLAYKTLLAHKTDYPDGSVFAKIGLKTNEDPSFESSIVPNGARRYQFMVRNKKKYSETQGWAYALFDEEGSVFPEAIKAQTMACAACHNIVPERGYVFSQMINLNPGKKENESKTALLENKMAFSTLDVSELPKEVQKHIPADFKSVRMVDGKLRKFLFQGTLEEIRPKLSYEVESTKLPALLLSEDATRFSLVIPENLNANCSDNGKSGIYMKSIYTMIKNNPEQSNEKILHFCYAH
jgi:hypothetical protein